ncbi:small ribosomal subunit Rsm22 family protein [Methanolobus sp. ZRKC2]|uniref:small ribosomal subunit Rsm22 family protein n=1 Tax=Methanolobus sp. ZRKC2 TaxID=3125783 RepID=UPI0032483F99
MSEKEIISALKYVSRMKAEFMLSEMRNYIKSEMSVQDIYKTARFSFFDLGLDIIPEDDDFRVLRAPKGFINLNDREEKINEAFFQTAGVSKKLEKFIEQYIEKKTGKHWDDKQVLERIRKAIVSQKADYWKEGKSRNISYEKGYSILGYLAYQFPVYFVQFQHILYDMAQDGLLKKRMKILDVGSGPGTISLATIDLYSRLDGPKAVVHSLEMYDENIEAYNAIVPQYAQIKEKVDIREPLKADISKIDVDILPEKIDLMVFSNVLNEIKEFSIPEKARLVKKMSEKLSHDGSILIIEPADKVNSTELRKLSIGLKGAGLSIYSPCSFIWDSGCNPVECWSFEQQKDIVPTRLMKKVAECDKPYRYINTDIKYSYVLLRKDKLTCKKYRVPKKAKYAKLSKLERHTEKRINVIASLMSGNLGDEKNSLFKICDGTSVKAVYAVLPSHNLTKENRIIMNAKYGSILSIENVLVRYNDANDSYNLLIGRGSVVNLVES